MEISLLVELGLAQSALENPELASASWRRALDSSKTGVTGVEEKNVYIAMSRLLAKLRLGLHDQMAEELEFLLECGVRDRDVELFCLESENPPICGQLGELFPPEPWPAASSVPKNPGPGL